MFEPKPARGIVFPIYAYGPGRVKNPIFTCPVSAVPDAVWQLMDLWLTCRAMKALPLAGGVLDQPYVVRRAWPMFEAAIAPYERQQNHDAQLAAMASMLSAVNRVRGRR